jgi:hypothetical protein
MILPISPVGLQVYTTISLDISFLKSTWVLLKAKIKKPYWGKSGK